MIPSASRGGCTEPPPQALAMAKAEPDRDFRHSGMAFVRFSDELWPKLLIEGKDPIFSPEKLPSNELRPRLKLRCRRQGFVLGGPIVRRVLFLFGVFFSFGAFLLAQERRNERNDIYVARKAGGAQERKKERKKRRVPGEKAKP